MSSTYQCRFCLRDNELSVSTSHFKCVYCKTDQPIAPGLRSDESEGAISPPANRVNPLGGALATAVLFMWLVNAGDLKSSAVWRFVTRKVAPLSTTVLVGNWYRCTVDVTLRLDRLEFYRDGTYTTYTGRGDGCFQSPNEIDWTPVEHSQYTAKLDRYADNGAPFINVKHGVGNYFIWWIIDDSKRDILYPGQFNAVDRPLGPYLRDKLQ